MSLKIPVDPNPADLILDEHNSQRFDETPRHHTPLDYHVAIVLDGASLPEMAPDTMIYGCMLWSGR